MSTRTACGQTWPALHETERPAARRRPASRLLAFAGLAVILMTAAPRPAKAFLMEPLERGLVAVTLDLSGESVEKVKEDASLRAVRACVGRVFWGQELLIALDLMSKYLQENHRRFVRGVEVLNTDYTAGRPELQVRVYVDNAALQNDLVEKRFVLRPRPRPYFKVFLAEKLDESFATYATGQQALSSALKDRNLYPYEEIIERPPENVDVVADPVLLEDGLIACERHGVELLISGSASTVRDATKVLYYDTYYFYTTTLDVTMIRVDTGDVIAKAKSKGTASHTDEQRAIDLSITRAANEATNHLIREYEKVWSAMVLDRADYHLLLTGVNPETLSLVHDALAGFSVDAKVFLRQSFDRTAVLNVVYPGKREEMIKAITTLSYPTLSIIPPIAIDAKLVGDATVTLAERAEIAAKLGMRIGEGESSTYNYVYETAITLRLVERGSDTPVVTITAKEKAASLDPSDAAYESWRKALNKGLLNLNQAFPPSIQVVTLREGIHRIRLPRDAAQVADVMAKRLKGDTALAEIGRSVEKKAPVLSLRYAEPKAEDESLLGRDPYLPDNSLVSSSRRNYLEIQVGE